ncbi:MAG: IS30 family transposase [Spirochaetes bacterium]|nr:IS30 family transposase [Spirochaetota bacterium]
MIAQCLGRNTSTISRELRRNHAPVYTSCYLPHRAQERAQLRWHTTHQRVRIADAAVRTCIDKQLALGWTPELIAGRLRLVHPERYVSHEAIYQYVYTVRRDLIPTLPFAHRVRRKRGSARGKRAAKIPNRVMIDKRPVYVESRKRFGDWEGDTLVSRASRTTLVVAAERRSRQIRLARTSSREAKTVSRAMIRNLRRAPQLPHHTLTLDNGLEFADHAAIQRSSGASVYFCRPYHSWEKGTVEQLNGLVRRFLPKGTDFAKVTRQELNRIESHLNNRPRKCLGFLTPNEFVALAA